jgi:hypothetical protein
MRSCQFPKAQQLLNLRKVDGAIIPVKFPDKSRQLPVMGPLNSIHLHGHLHSWLTITVTLRPQMKVKAVVQLPLVSFL